MLEQDIEYPYAIGQTKGNDASAEAQEKAGKSSLNARHRRDVLRVFKRLGPSTTERIADDLRGVMLWRYSNEGDFFQDIRRRCSELKKAGLIVDSGDRLPSNRNGNTITVWMAA